MKTFVKCALVMVTLLMSVVGSFAAEVKTPGSVLKGTATPAVAGVKTDTKAAAGSSKESLKSITADAKSAAKAKLVDINTATADELKAVPGLGDAFAAKIIAGRPYANKTQLKSRKILPATVYEQVRDLIIAKKINK